MISLSVPALGQREITRNETLEGDTRMEDANRQLLVGRSLSRAEIVRIVSKVPGFEESSSFLGIPIVRVKLGATEFRRYERMITKDEKLLQAAAR